ncbi:hypothetical protein [Rhodoplanes elegans]|uniref:hypothetical protein n=1 Tax=Rhodoplanes elegans TaxID=29408 RepID=UPI001FD52F76|nr:hypothetical protein [Rhodoplanes elegans]
MLAAAAVTGRAAAFVAALALLAPLPNVALAQDTGPGQAPASGIPSITVHPDPNAQPAAPTVVPPPEPAIGVTIDWQVKNRFRLFRDEKDFQRHVTAAAGRSVLATEQALAAETGGRGWARDTVVRLCTDAAGRVADECQRDGVRESYLAPADHRIEARLAGAVDPAAQCTWTFEDGDSLPRSVTAPCAEPVNLRVVFGKPTIAVVDIVAPGGATAGGATAVQPARRATTEILVQDLLIAGLGDSIASGEGNPDRPVVLSDEGFCFRRFGGGGRNEFFRPGRQGFKGDKACESGGAGIGSDGDRAEWARLSARWMSAPCHRSLYGYQLRAALALAVENPRLAVTFLPLACTGATIETGLFAGQPSRELNCGTSGSASCPRQMPGQIAQLRDLVAKAQKAHPQRGLDLVFLTIGANDVDFSGLVADVIIDASAERTLFRRAGVIGSVEASQRAIDTTLPTGFQRLRGALKPLLGGSLERLVYVSYGHPALSPQGGACPTSRDGFDVHPAFGVDGDRLARISQFVERGFFPRLKALATCTGGVACAAPARDRMTFVDAHQPVFADHGFCARAAEDPPFDRDCFATDGTSFATSPVEGATAPLNCAARPSDFRPYAPRARWIRTANDSYFAAMTFPEGVSPTMQPSDLHDATWGVLSAVYGGAVHPTAEGHAAMADAALPAARGVLGLPQPDTAITAEPLPPALPSSGAAGPLPTPPVPQTAGSGALPGR